MKWDTPEALVAYLRANPTSDAGRAAADMIERLREALSDTQAMLAAHLNDQRERAAEVMAQMDENRAALTLQETEE